MLEEIMDLEAYTDPYYSKPTMDLDIKNPYKQKKTDSSTDTEHLGTTDIEVTLLGSINKKLDLLIPLHNELRASLAFAHNHITSLLKSNQERQSSVKSLNEQMQKATAENKQLKETVLDTQTRSIHDNLIFSGISEKTPDRPEPLIKDFLTAHLKIPPDITKDIAFHRVHRLGTLTAEGPQPIIAKKLNTFNKTY